jgi:PAS domain S-box-containing protein
MPTDPKDIQALRERAEKALSEGSEKPALMSGTDLQKLLHELSVYQIELEMQNEELRRSQEQLEESHSEYAELYDFAPVGYLTFDEKALITRANLTACGLLGIERSFLVKKPFTLFIHPDYQDLFCAHKQNALKSTATETCQLVLKRKDGTFFDAQLESAPVQFNGQPALNSILTDITERRQFEKEREAASLELEGKVKERTAELLRANELLRKSESRERERAGELATLLETVPTPVVIVHDPDSLHMTGNREANELLRIPSGGEVSLSAPAEAKPRHFRALKDGRELRLDELPAQRAARGDHVRDFEFSLVFDTTA